MASISNVVFRSCRQMSQRIPQIQPSSRHFSLTSIQNVRGPNSLSSTLSAVPASDQEVQIENNPELLAESKEIWAKINQQIANKSFGRLFAIVDIGGHQHKLTEGDLVMVLEDIGAPNGKRIRLEKIPLVGSKDFTLIGRPYLPRDLVTVDATVVEKAMGHKKINHYRKGPREVKMTEFHRDMTTTLRINKIELVNPVDQTSDRKGFEKPVSKDPLSQYSKK